jgi:pyruvate formate lyase activating enzyme
MEQLLEFSDLFLFDIKCMGPEKHQKSVGRSNDLILENAVKISRQKHMKIRVPIIPGFNDNPSEIQAITQYVKTMLGDCTIDLLPYNRMGESKYERLGRSFVPLEAIVEDRIEELRQIVDSCLQN